VNGISLHFQFVARIAKRHFSDCYSMCYSSRRTSYACSGIRWGRYPDDRATALIWCVGSLVRATGFSPALA
jgi:phage terminase large subunit-like protein